MKVTNMLTTVSVHFELPIGHYHLPKPTDSYNIRTWQKSCWRQQWSCWDWEQRELLTPGSAAAVPVGCYLVCSGSGTDRKVQSLKVRNLNYRKVQTILEGHQELKLLKCTILEAMKVIIKSGPKITEKNSQSWKAIRISGTRITEKNSQSLKV